MSEFHVEVVEVGPIRNHPNADRLEITDVHGGYPCILRKGDFKEGDLAVYIPVDAIVPHRAEFEFLGTQEGKVTRIKAKKLRGIFSMGLLIPNHGNHECGESVVEHYGITKYDPQANQTLSTGGECEAGPEGWVFQKYTNLEGLRKYKYVLEEGEEVVLTEKIHGANARYCYADGKLWVGSRTQIKRWDETGKVMWCKAAMNCDLEAKLAKFPNHIFYGEVYGKVQDLRYGLDQDVTFRCFDIFSVLTQSWLDYDDVESVCRDLGIDTAPTFYRGPWLGYEEMKSHAEGKTVVGGEHVREGFVVKPTQERWDERVGRVILKMPGEGYLLRHK